MLHDCFSGPSNTHAPWPMSIGKTVSDYNIELYCYITVYYQQKEIIYTILDDRLLKKKKLNL